MIQIFNNKMGHFFYEVFKNFDLHCTFLQEITIHEDECLLQAEILYSLNPLKFWKCHMNVGGMPPPYWLGSNENLYIKNHGVTVSHLKWLY